MWGIALALFLVVGLIGPWPVDHQTYTNEPYAKTTFTGIANAKFSAQDGPLSAGVGVAEITPPPGVPLAGYSAREPKANTSARDTLFAKALTLSNGHDTITVVSGDFLLPLPELTTAILTRTGLSREQVYFAATHTHSGPGGYAHGLVAHFALGNFDQAEFDRLVNSFSAAITTSRASLQPASLNYRRIALPRAVTDTLIRNQLAPTESGHNSIHVLQVRVPDQTAALATLVTFSAHPTFFGKVNHQASGDYPALLQQRLEKRWGGTVMFAAGAVGGMLPVGESDIPSGTLEAQAQQLQDMTQRLEKAITDTDSSELGKAQTTVVQQWQSDRAVLASAVVPINLPSPTLRVSDNLRLSPLLVTQLFHDNETFIHGLRIGPIVLVGMPSDYAGELAVELERRGDARGHMTWVTNFNGDYIGYSMPQRRYSDPHYATRSANFYGPWTGEYLAEAAERLASKLQSPE